MSFKIVQGPIRESRAEPEAHVGAVITFTGIVRNHNDGRAVESLRYEAYETLAITEGERILKEAVDRFDVSRIDAAHSVGELKIGDTAFIVSVTSAHRDAAFAACRFVVDEVKRRVPIWKQEQYADGSSEWLKGSRPANESDYYDRQTRIPIVGASGQAKLKGARVLVVGAGGLGCNALQHLAAAGVGVIGICEGDKLDVSNLHRQTLYDYSHVGRQKCGLAAQRLREVNPHISVIEHSFYLERENVDRLLIDYDFALDCGDNFDLSYLLNDACMRLDKTLISGSIYQFEGTVFVVRPSGPCLRCLWPQEPAGGCVSNCADVGVLGFVPGIVGALQAAEVIKCILGVSPLNGEMLTVGFLPYSLSRIALIKNDRCPNCSRVDHEPEVLTISQIPHNAIIVDCRSPEETHTLPLAKPHVLHKDQTTWLQSKTYVLVCETGTRSLAIAREARAKGHKNVSSFEGGRRRLERLRQEQLSGS
jgi:adenylyltransferase/sulfurtransferase